MIWNARWCDVLVMALSALVLILGFVWHFFFDGGDVALITMLAGLTVGNGVRVTVIERYLEERAKREER